MLKYIWYPSLLVTFKHASNRLHIVTNIEHATTQIAEISSRIPMLARRNAEEYALLEEKNNNGTKQDPIFFPNYWCF